MNRVHPFSVCSSEKENKSNCVQVSYNTLMVISPSIFINNRIRKIETVQVEVIHYSILFLEHIIVNRLLLFVFY